MLGPPARPEPLGRASRGQGPSGIGTRRLSLETPRTEPLGRARGDGPQGKCDGVIWDAGVAADELCRVACAARISTTKIFMMVTILKNLNIEMDASGQYQYFKELLNALGAARRERCGAAEAFLSPFLPPATPPPPQP